MDCEQMEPYFHSMDLPPPPEMPSELPVMLPVPEPAPERCEDGYCRLCATRQPSHQLRSFATSNPTADNLFTLISRLNIGIRRGDGLPQVACSMCLQRLESYNNFVQGITSAQTVLTAMFMPEQLNSSFRSNQNTTSCASEDDTSSGEEIFGCGKIKREKPKDQRRNPKRSVNKPKSSTVEITIEPDMPPPSAQKQPVKSEDPNIKRWSDFLCCKRCEFRSESVHEIRQHSWSSHTRCAVFKCLECPAQISTFKRFVRHMIKHHKSLEQCCEFCNQTFASEWDVIVHKRLDHADEARPYKCNRCGITFNTPPELQAHQDAYCIVKSKNAGDRRAKCNICDKEFLNFITLQSHMDTHDPSKNVCTICNKVYKNKYILSQHHEFVHSDSVRFICQVCGKGFKVKQHLKRHVDVHNDVRPYPCDKCDKRFRSPSQVKSHQTCHSDESIFTCHLCTKSYKFRAGLRDHMRAHNNERPYSCDSCERSFLSWSNYNKHMKAIHKRNMARSSSETMTTLCQL